MLSLCTSAARSGLRSAGSGMQAQPRDFCLRSERPPVSPQPAAAVVEAWLSDAVVTLPFDQDPGTAERFTELWAKAFQEVSSLLSLSVYVLAHKQASR